MSEAVLAYLIERQRADGLSGVAMAQRLGLSETQWSHLRHGRRKLTVALVERAIVLYPELAERITAPEAVAS